jgi:hypothetical protein
VVGAGTPNRSRAKDRGQQSGHPAPRRSDHDAVGRWIHNSRVEDSLARAGIPSVRPYGTSLRRWNSRSARRAILRNCLQTPTSVPLVGRSACFSPVRRPMLRSTAPTAHTLYPVRSGDSR